MNSASHLIRHMCPLGGQMFVWSQYYDEAIVRRDPKLNRSFASGRTQIESIGGAPVRSHERRYNSGWLTYFQPGFCGGMHISTYWLTLDAMRQCFEALGFEITAQETAISAHGPHVTLLAQRRPTSCMGNIASPP